MVSLISKLDGRFLFTSRHSNFKCASGGIVEDMVDVKVDLGGVDVILVDDRLKFPKQPVNKKITPMIFNILSFVMELSPSVLRLVRCWSLDQCPNNNLQPFYTRAIPL